MSEKIINLINIKIQNDSNAEIELLYKSSNIDESLKIFLQNSEGKKITPQKTTLFLDDPEKKLKVQFQISLEKDEQLQLKLEECNHQYEVKLLDNKNQTIVDESNPFNIFTKNRILHLNFNKGIFTIKPRKLGSKLRYEWKKQKYAIQKYHRPYLLRLLKKSEKYYLFNDRIMYGDDNAEQLFSYINQNHKKMAKNCYFVLDKNSDRIEQVKKLGKVVLYGSLQHKYLFLNSKMVISSHASYYDRVFNPFNEQEMNIYKDKINKQFVFLQHGVIENDLHDILNRQNMLADLFVTTTRREYEEVKSAKYLYDENMVISTGLPRFDKLVDERKKIILIAPTWRAFLTQVEYTDHREKEFEKSEFYQKYQSLLQNEKLLSEIEKRNYTIKFLLHPVFEEYKSLFSKLKKPNIEILSTKDIKYSELFKECSLFITDYSSTHFDVAFLQKPIIYYQFDQEKFYASHYKKGFFNSFGQIVEKEQELVDKIIYYLQNNCQIEEQYKNSIHSIFAYTDHQNAKRVYEEIVKLAQKHEKNYRFNNVH